MRTKLGLTTLVGVLILLGLPGVARAQCTDFEIVLADGRPRTVTIPFNGTGTFKRGVFFRAAPGRSYSVEVFGGRDVNVTEIFLDAVNASSCPTTNAAGVRDTIDIEPRGFDGSRPVRFSFTNTAPVTGLANPFFVTRVRNPSTTTAQTVTITVADTTLFNSAWSTFGTFETFYSIVNTTRATLNTTLKLFDTTGTEVASFDFTNIPAGGTVSTNTSALGVANNLNGSATLTHDGPPGAVIAEAAIANFAVTPNIIQPVKFETVRQ